MVNKDKKKIPELILAPMAGITDSAFRRVCKELGADIVYSEMVSVDGLFYNSEKTRDLIKFFPEESPYVLQIFGKKPKLFYKAAEYIRNLKNPPDGIDINFGCPAKKVTNHGGGVKLMLDIPLAREIISATILGAKDIPVSIKIRAGIKDMTAEKFLDGVKDLPWKTVMIHGRTYEEGFAGKADWKLVKKIKKKFPDRKVVVNGGIFSPKDAVQALKESNADAIALGQGVLGKPWLFAQIKDFFINNKYHEVSVVETKKVVLFHLKLLLEEKPEKGIFEFRKHLAWYFKGFPNATKLRSRLVQVLTYKDVVDILKEVAD